MRAGHYLQLRLVRDGGEERFARVRGRGEKRVGGEERGRGVIKMHGVRWAVNGEWVQVGDGRGVVVVDEEGVTCTGCNASRLRCGVVLSVVVVAWRCCGWYGGEGGGRRGEV